VVREVVVHWVPQQLMVLIQFFQRLHQLEAAKVQGLAILENWLVVMVGPAGAAEGFQTL
jgi:hypothetical protein